MSKYGFCGLINKIDGLYLALVPGDSAATQLTFEDVDSYLSHLKYMYDKTAVANQLRTLTNACEIKLSDTPLKFPVPETLIVKVDSDRLKASGKFYPPTKGGVLMTKEDIYDRLKVSGIKYGANEMNMNMFLNDRVYGKEIILAQALMPVEGKNAVIHYYFNVDLTRKPQTNDDGSVDFHKLDNISPVHKGDMIASLDPADEGKPGIDVCGNVIRQKKVEKRILKHANKIYLSEDKTKMYSEVDGHASLVDDKVFVSDNYEVPTDVGPSTGDINYEGNVTIKGNVNSGYTVYAHGDIIVEGVVEAATLIADGQIILKRGIQGGGKGSLKARSNIIAKFIESAEVISEGYIQTEAILHSFVSARGDVLVSGKRGLITGGEVRSITMISMKSAGNSMGTRTLLEVGVDPEVIDETRRLEKETPSMIQEIEKIDQILVAYAKKVKSGEKLDPRILSSVKDSMTKKKLLSEAVEANQARLNSLIEMTNANANGSIRVQDTIFPGCRLAISNVCYYVKNEIQHSRFIKEGADIRVTML